MTVPGEGHSLRVLTLSQTLQESDDALKIDTGGTTESVTVTGECHVVAPKEVAAVSRRIGQELRLTRRVAERADGCGAGLV